MKSNLVRVSILALGAAAAYAQTQDPVHANVPFNFSVRGMNLPAGDYTVETKTPMVVILRSRESHTSVIVNAGGLQSLYPKKDGLLVFHRYGDQYFLEDIWIGGTTSGRHIPPSKAERKLAQRQTEPGVVVLASLR